MWHTAAWDRALLVYHISFTAWWIVFCVCACYAGNPHLHGLSPSVQRVSSLPQFDRRHIHRTGNTRRCGWDIFHGIIMANWGRKLREATDRMAEMEGGHQYCQKPFFFSAFSFRFPVPSVRNSIWLRQIDCIPLQDIKHGICLPLKRRHHEHLTSRRTAFASNAISVSCFTFHIDDAVSLFLFYYYYLHFTFFRVFDKLFRWIFFFFCLAPLLRFIHPSTLNAASRVSCSLCTLRTLNRFARTKLAPTAYDCSLHRFFSFFLSSFGWYASEM